MKRNQCSLKKLKHNISTYINKSLFKFKTQKSTKTTKIIGLSSVELKQYLESKFQLGMTWDNYGEWHIDHICPLSQAVDENELYKLWNYSNLQPMWAYLNISKSDSPTKQGKELCLNLLNRSWNERC